jgi:hypothetical protein
MLDAFGHDQEVSRPQFHVPVSHLHRQATRDYEKELVGVVMVVPDPLSLGLDRWTL